MPTTLQFSDGTTVAIKERTDYARPDMQELLRAHKGDQGILCLCQSGKELKMKIATLPRRKELSLNPDDGAADSQRVSKGIVPTSSEVRELYVRRQSATRDEHAKDCPHLLPVRDSTANNRGARKFPSSIFWPPIQKASGLSEVRAGGSFTGRNLGTFASFCSSAVFEAAHNASCQAGKPFGTPTLKIMFSSVREQLLENKALADTSFNPFELAEAKKCRLEYGIHYHSGFGLNKPQEGGLVALQVSVADEMGGLRTISYLMSAELYRAATKQVQRHQSCIKPPYFWMGVISGGNRLVRFWQWPVVVYENQIVLVDSNPEAKFVLGQLWEGNAVYKVKSLENLNKLLRDSVPKAQPVLSEFDFLIRIGRVLEMVEVVSCDESKRGYRARLERKERTYGAIVIKGKLHYRQADMRFPSRLGENL